MDANLIYEKTTAGEEAVRQRTRVVQRNTRMVLILVDGKSSVGELCEKAGNAQMVESALQDLERDGLVVPKLARDSVWDQSRKVAEEIRNAAVARLGKDSGASDSGAATPAPPPASQVPLPVQARAALAASGPISAVSDFAHSSAPEPFSIAPLSVAPHSVFSETGPASTFPSASRSVPQLNTNTPASGKPENSGGLLQRLSGSFARKDDDDLSIKAIRRGARGPYISLPLGIALGLGSLFVLVAAVFALYPYDRHRADIETGLSKLIGLPVKVGEVKAVFSPKPAISVDKVQAGGTSDGIHVAHLRLVPELLSLLGSRPAFSSVEADSVSVSNDALGLLHRVMANAAQADAPARVDQVSINRLSVSVLGLVLPDLHGEMSLAGKGVPESVMLANADRTLRFALKSQAKGFIADVEGYAWRPLPDMKYQFDSVQGQAVWDGNSLVIRSFDARIFDGAIQGVLLLDGGKGPSFSADVSVKHMNVRRLGDAFGYPGQFEGELAGNFKVSGVADAWSDVLGALAGGGEFSVQRGVLGGFDLVEAVRRSGKTPVRGGSTRYEQMTGRLKLSPEGLRFGDLALNAGVLRAGGSIDVARDRKVGGRLDVEMRGSANLVRMPLAVSGTLKEPSLLATR